MKKMRNDPDMLEEYDFRRGVRGKYAQRRAEDEIDVEIARKRLSEIEKSRENLVQGDELKKRLGE